MVFNDKTLDFLVPHLLHFWYSRLLLQIARWQQCIMRHATKTCVWQQRERFRIEQTNNSKWKIIGNHSIYPHSRSVLLGKLPNRQWSTFLCVWMAQRACAHAHSCVSMHIEHLWGDTLFHMTKYCFGGIQPVSIFLRWMRYSGNLENGPLPTFFFLRGSTDSQFRLMIVLKLFYHRIKLASIRICLLRK